MAEFSIRSNESQFVNGVGVVKSFLSKHKALLVFDNKSIEGVALLKTERMAVRGALLNQVDDEGVQLAQLVGVGTRMRLYAHPLDAKEADGTPDAQWFVMYAWTLADEEEIDIELQPGLHNRECQVADINTSGKRRGLLKYAPPGEPPVKISFLLSKVYQFGSRLNPKNDNWKNLIDIDDTYMCDAVPQLCPDSDEVTWMATVVHKGAKPQHSSHQSHASDVNSLDQVSKSLAQNSRALFVVGEGRFMRLINDELGLAMLRVAPNIFESVLFSRTTLCALGQSMQGQKLSDILCEGDPLKMICTSASQGDAKNTHTFKWVACSVKLNFQEADDE